MNTTEKLVELPLSGVESEHCAMIIDKGLAKVPGIITHKVELNNHKAVITATDDQVIPPAVHAIRDLGYDVDTLKQSFPVTGMSCASCASSAQSIVSTLPGVIQASVNFANTTLQVEYIPTIATPEKLRQALQSVGYDLIIEEAKRTQEVLEELHFTKLQSLKKRTLWSMAFTIPMMILGMFIKNFHYQGYILWALATPVVFVLGRQFFIGAFKQAKHRSANMDTLVALSTGIAYLFSVFNTLYPQFWWHRGLESHLYFEVAAFVITFILLGRLLEERAKASTATAIKKLMGLQPNTVTLVQINGQMIDLPIEHVKVGDVLLVKPGGKIPVDGTVEHGESYIDESMISGEPIPVLKTLGTKVFAGTINQKGSFQFRAEKVGSDTLLAHIIKMVQEAQGSKAPVQKLVDKIAGIFVPVVIGIALLSFTGWIILGGENGMTQGLLALVTVLIIACPCALGLATPTAIMVGVGKGAEHGILIKDAEALELSYKVNSIVLDKTGTITEGRPKVTDVIWTEETQAYKNILFSLEKASEHPLAEAITEYYKSEGKNVILSDVQSITGTGISGVANGETYFIGTRQLLVQNHIFIDQEVMNWSEQKRVEAKTVVFFSNSKQVLASLAIADRIKASSNDAIQRLKSLGIDVYMFTGDNEQTAKAIANQAGISHYKAEALPQDKYEFVRELQQKGKVVAMVGDGINDSQALAQADISIAMGKGSDIAMDAAKMTLMTSDLARIPSALRLSKKTVQTIKQNLFWAFIYNVVGIPIAAGLLYPVNGFVLNPMIAGAAMALSSVSVVTNSLRLKWMKL